MAVSAGLPLRWSLMGGKILGVLLIMGHDGMLPGDIAIVSTYSHHFMLTGFPAGPQVHTLEGNTGKQMIRRSQRDIASIVGYYRTVPL